MSPKISQVGSAELARPGERAGSFPLNAEQRAAVEHGEGPLLVVAGAGTGKTRVITERIRRLLERDLPAESTLGLTFTDKAAGEMKHRVVKAVGERAKGVWLSTFHSFCLNRVLLPVNPNIRVLDETEHWILLRRHLAELELEHFVRLADPGEFLNDFVKFFSRCQDELVSAADYERYVARLRSELEGKSLDADARLDLEEEIARQEEVARAYRVSERLLGERNLITYGGQMMQAVERLRADEKLLRGLREQYRYILVDEFQDTNIAQLELLWLLSSDHRNIFAVGDHNQAIYRFRGASYGSFTIFLQKFCGAHADWSDAAAKEFRRSLVENYRSTRRILRVAGEVIAHNDRSPLVPLEKLTTENPEGERIRIVEFGTPEEEAWWVASEIKRMHGPANPWKNFAVLYRKHTHRSALLDALRRKGIPFVIRNFSILSSTLVRDLLAYLKLIAVPGDNVACARVLAAPYWGLEPRDLVRLAERAERNRRQPLSEALESAQREFPFTRKDARIPELLELLDSLRNSAGKLTASEVLNELIARLGLAPLPSDADHRYLERFVRFVKDWEKTSEGKRLPDFIEYFRYFEEAGGAVALEEEAGENAVQLMTVHAAKGLEFPHVFVLRLSRNDFPASRRAPVFEFPEELMKEEKPKGGFHMQEERRLFYVALTRAKRSLTLTTVLGGRKKPSPFLEDILMSAAIQKRDTAQLAPRVEIPPANEAAGPASNSAASPSLFSAPGGASRAYSQIALWAKSFHPPLAEPLQLSASAVETYQTCPMKYLFQKVWGLRGGPHAEMIFGSVMHKTIQEFVREMRRRGKIPLEEIVSIYQREWSSAGFLDKYQEELYRQAGLAQLRNFHQSYSASPADVLFQEKFFELPLPHNIILTGRMDQVNRLGKREIEIVDYKTGRPKDAKKAGESLQLSVYAMAALEILELKPSRLVFYNLSNNEPVETSRDAKALEKTKQTIAEAADLIRAGEFPARPGYPCAKCDYRPVCPAHEQLISLTPAEKTGPGL